MGMLSRNLYVVTLVRLSRGCCLVRKRERCVGTQGGRISRSKDVVYIRETIVCGSTAERVIRAAGFAQAGGDILSRGNIKARKFREFIDGLEAINCGLCEVGS